MRRFELREGTSSKFWQIEQDGASITVAFGKIGTAGQAQVKSFPTEAKARAEHDKLVKEKTGKGYAEVAVATGATMPAATPKAAKETGATPVEEAKAPVEEAPAPAAAPEPPAPAAAPVAAGSEKVRIAPWQEPEHARRGVTLPRKAEGNQDPRAVIVEIVGNLDKAWNAGARHTDAELEDLAARAAAALRAPSLAALGELDETGLGAALHLLSPSHDGLSLGAEATRAILAVRSPAFFLRALERANAIRSTGERDSAWKMTSVSLHAGTDGVQVASRGSVAAGLSALREVLAHAPEERYAEARAVADSLRSKAPQAFAVALAYVFPTEGWGDTLAQRILEATGKDELPEYAWALLASVSDPTVAMALFRKAMSTPYSNVPEDLAHAVVDALGEHAVPIVAKLLDGARDAYLKERYAPVLGRIESLAAAEEMARVLEDKTLRPFAIDLFQRVPGLAVRALAAVAASRSKDASGAAAMLRTYVAEKRSVVTAALPSLDPAARRVVDGLIADASVPGAAPGDLPADLRALPPMKKAKTMPAFWKPENLPRPLLASRDKRLSVPAMQILGALLAASTLDAPHPSLPGVKKALDPESLAAFAWGLFSAWLGEGEGSSKENWAFTALGHLGGDEAARKLTPRIREWPGENAIARATLGLDVLATIGTDVALMNLNGIAEKVKFKSLQERARAKIQQIAAARGLTSEELADLLVPDLGLDDHGALRLDFGPRAFRVAFDHELKPFVLDEGGKQLSDLPKPNKSDDAEKAAAAQATWKALKQDVKALANAQILRLERAMCSRRTWKADTFRQVVADHPLMRHLARRLVWGVYADGRLGKSFRVDEEGGLTDEKDTPFTLEPGTSVGIPHVLESAALGTVWGPLFGDYEIVQPFAQFGRPTFAPTDAEKKSASLDRVKDKKVKLGHVLGLLNQGWEKGYAQDAGWIWDLSKPLPGGFEVTLELKSGLMASGMARESPPEQELGTVGLATKTPAGKKKVTWGDVDPIGFSELVYDLNRLLG